MVFTQVIENFVIIWRGLVTAVSAVVAAFTAVGTAVQSVVSTMASVGTQISNAWNAIPGIVSAVWNTVVTTVTGAITSLVTIVVNGGTQVMTEVGTWPGRIKGFFADAGSWLVEAGKNIVQGLISGISDMATAAVAKAQELASSVKNAFTSFLGIHSPSTVMADIGGFIGQGLIDGLKSKQSEIEKTVQGIGQTVKDVFDWSGYAQRGLDAGFDFAGANADQFMSDLGIGGKGFISQLGEQGLKLGTQLAGQALTHRRDLDVSGYRPSTAIWWHCVSCRSGGRTAFLVLPWFTSLRLVESRRSVPCKSRTERCRSSPPTGACAVSRALAPIRVVVSALDYPTDRPIGRAPVDSLNTPWGTPSDWRTGAVRSSGVGARCTQRRLENRPTTSSGVSTRKYFTGLPGMVPARQLFVSFTRAWRAASRDIPARSAISRTVECSSVSIV